MGNRKRTMVTVVFHTVAVLILAWASGMSRAHASADPETACIVLHALLAAGIAALVFGKTVYARVSSLFAKPGSGPGEDAPGSGGDAGDAASGTEYTVNSENVGINEVTTQQ